MSLEDFDDREVAALGEAMGAFGRYVESLGKFDLTTLTPQEFEQAIACTIRAYETAWRAQHSGET